MVPQTLNEILDIDPLDFASVVVDRETHKGLTKKWNAVLDDIKNASKNGGDVKIIILENAEKIYKDYPEMLEVTKNWLKSF